VLATLALALLQAPPATPATESTTVVRAARMLDVASGRIVEHPQIVVRGGRIEQVGTAQSPVPADALVIDLGELTLVPGLIDCHTHLSDSLEGDFVNRAVHEGPADAALHGASNARKTLLAGFTTVRDVGSSEFVDVALAHAVERGEIDGPWIVPCGHAIGITGGHADQTGFRPGILEGDPLHGIADGPDECRKAVREQIKYGAKAIKCVATAGVLSFEDSVGAQQLTDEELRAIVDEAGRHGLKVAAHAHGAQGILAAVRAGVASIEHGSQLTDESIAEMKARGTYLVPTAYLRRAVDYDHLPEKLRAKATSIFPTPRPAWRARSRAACASPTARTPRSIPTATTRRSSRCWSPQA
jgi:imidazolonepropionase-like amidohydrolase